MRTVLISGAGIAGATLAYWLTRHGLEPTLVERSTGLRSSGNPVDVREPALPIVDAMGVTATLRQRATRASGAIIIGPDGRPIAKLNGPNRDRGATAEIEVPRADLAEVLLGACDGVELIFDDSIATLADGPDGVDVGFDSGLERHFDLVIGADGVHSNTRKLIFGSEHQFVAPLGMYVGTLPTEVAATAGKAVQLYNVPGRLTALHPGRDQPGAAFIFRREPVTGFDPRDLDQHKALIMDSYADVGWLVPQLLEQVRDADDLYFDAVSRIDLPHWSRGRVGLIGDAASCVSLLGDGSTKAIIGAHTLAAELAGTVDHEAAFRRYQARQAPMISSPSRVALGAAMLVPKSRAGLAARNTAAKIISAVSQLR